MRGVEEVEEEGRGVAAPLMRPKVMFGHSLFVDLRQALSAMFHACSCPLFWHSSHNVSFSFNNICALSSIRVVQYWRLLDVCFSVSFNSPWGVPQIVTLGVSLSACHSSLIRFISSFAFSRQPRFPDLLPLPLQAIGASTEDILMRSATVLALLVFCKQLMTFDLVWRFLFFANGWWKAGIFSLRFDGALITEILALYLCAASTISFSEFGSFSDRILIGHVWLIHSPTILDVISCASSMHVDSPRICGLIK